MVVNSSTSGLNDENILSPHRLGDFHSCLAAGEFAEETFCRWDAQMVTDGLGELGMGCPANDDNVSHHDGCVS